MGMEFKLSFDEQKKRDLWCDVYARCISCGNSSDVSREEANEAVRNYEGRFIETEEPPHGGGPSGW